MRFLVVLSILFATWFYWDDFMAVKELPVPVSLVQKIHNMPAQQAVQPSSIAFLDGRLNFLASYEVTARVLARSNYYTGTAGKLSPIDFALGWGPMSGPGIGKRLSIGQGHRTYHYSWSDVPPMPLEQIVQNSANTHLIPANDTVKKQLNKIRKNQLVTLKGYLVKYREDHDNGGWWEWQSSLVRTDTGDGSCELLYVQSVTVY